MFIVMEYIEGQELKSILQTNRKTPLPACEMINYANQIAKGLQAAHEKDIIHRDIKSSNIMITPKGQVKITDFGLAKIKGRSAELTTDTTYGTLAYMSPEQLRGARTDNRTDIWSFGVVLYEMLTGKLPFEREYDHALIYSILNEDFEINAENKDACKMLEPIIKKSLSKDKNERYRQVDDILADLRGERKNIEYERVRKVQGSEINPLNEKEKIKPGKKALKIIIPSMVVLLIAAAVLFFNPFKSSYIDKPGIVSTSNSLAIMYFEDIPDPSDKDHTGEMLTNLLITSLSQTKEMEVISREQLYRILEDIGLSDNKIITSKTAIKVARNAGVSTILVGSILHKVPSLAVTTRLIDVNSGNILGSQRLVGYKYEQIFSFVDSLALLVKKDLNISKYDISKTKSVADVTTNSPEAYRAYMEGLNFADKLYFKEANTAFKKAIELDSSFAMAYYHLSLVQDDPVESREILRKAVELADKATERERLLIFARNYIVQSKRKKASEIYKKIIEKYPHEIQAYEGLAYIPSQDLSLDLILLGVHNNPSSKMLWNDLAMSYALNNQKQKALDAVNEYIKLSPAEPNPYDTKGWIYTMFTEYDSSAIYYKKVLEFRKDFWSSAMKLGFYDVLKGKYKGAQKYFDMSGELSLRYPSINVHRGLLNSEIKRLENLLKTINDTWQIASTRAILIHLYYETAQFQKMLQLARKSVSDWKKIFTSKDHYGRTLLVWALAKNSKYMKAGKIIEGMQKNKDDSFPWVLTHASFALSILSFEEGNYELALEKFNKTFSKLYPNHEPNLFHAICLLKTGRIQDAVEQFNRIKNWPMSLYQMNWVPGGKYYGYINNVKAHYWLGVAYEKLGEKEKAINEYKTFLDTWKDADFNSPEIKSAHIRVAILEEK